MESQGLLISAFVLSKTFKNLHLVTLKHTSAFYAKLKQFAILEASSLTQIALQAKLPDLREFLSKHSQFEGKLRRWRLDNSYCDWVTVVSGSAQRPGILFPMTKVIVAIVLVAGKIDPGPASFKAIREMSRVPIPDSRGKSK